MTSSNDSAGYLWTINATRWFVDDSNETLGIDWDDWDVSLWTPEQRQLLERGGVSRRIHVALGVLLISSSSSVSPPIPPSSTSFPGTRRFFPQFDDGRPILRL
jgi:hypothetical protein